MKAYSLYNWLQNIKSVKPFLLHGMIVNYLYVHILQVYILKLEL